MGEAHARCCLVRHKAAFILMLCAFGSFATRSTRVAAWADAPLCVAQPPQVTEYPQRDSGPLLCEPEEPYSYSYSYQTLQQGPLWTAPIGPDEARQAFKEALALTETSPTDALVKLRLVERALPRIADRLAVQRAELLLKLNRPTEACDAYRLAVESIDPNVAAEARIGLVKCLLEAGDKSGEAELDRLLRRYPALSERSALQVKLAKAREGWRNIAGAVPLYRNIDLFSPETGAAADAREAIARLREQGVAVQPYTPQEWVERAERLVYRGTIEAGRNAVGDLLAMSAIRGVVKGRAHILAARVARMEGRWDAVRDEVAHAIESGLPKGDCERWLPRVPVETSEPGQGEEKLKRLLGGRPLDKLKFPQIHAALDIAVHYNMPEVASTALNTLSAMGSRLSPPILFESAVSALGVASHDSLRAAFESLRSVRPYQQAALYYHARALEGLGRDEEARAEFREVSALDQGWERYFGVWAEARLSGMDQLAANSCERDERGACLPDVGVGRHFDANGKALLEPSRALQTFLPGLNAGPNPAFMAEISGRPNLAIAPALSPQPAPTYVVPDYSARTAPVYATSEISAVFGSSRAEKLGVSEREPSYVPTATDHRRETIVARLGALAAVHGAAFPWLDRAVDLAELELYDEAATEVGEVYLAYKDARGGVRMRVGAEAVLTNAMQPRHECPAKTCRDRLLLDEWARLSLA
ncbi:MAG: hypothetical protein RL701_3140, partial [Pseudomonadota bacterium]